MKARMKTYKQLHIEFTESVRRKLVQGLSQCTADQCTFFKRMYANGDMELSCAQVVAKMSMKNVKTAIDLVRRTLEKNARR